MIITITSKNEKGLNGLQKYFPTNKWFEIKCKLSDVKIKQEKKDNQLIITINKRFVNDNKDKIFIIWMIQDLKKEQNITNMIDYNMEVKFNE